MTLSYELPEVVPYINWAYYYHAWQVKQSDERRRLREEAEAFLVAQQERYHTHAVLMIAQAYADGDDIVLSIDGTETTFPCLRQQHGQTCRCLADFIAPQRCAPSVDNQIGLFATSTDAGMEHDFDADPYLKMMAQLLADRLAEATAERLHEQVRKQLWGYAPNEQLSIGEMQQEDFHGIRPAVGYPSLPDASLNFLLDRLLDMRQIGITLTESGAMRPHASVSGLMIAHPSACYFGVGKIGHDQLSDYARRRGLSLETMQKFLSANL